MVNINHIYHLLSQYHIKTSWLKRQKPSQISIRKRVAEIILYYSNCYEKKKQSSDSLK